MKKKVFTTVTAVIVHTIDTEEEETRRIAGEGTKKVRRWLEKKGFMPTVITTDLADVDVDDRYRETASVYRVNSNRYFGYIQTKRQKGGVTLK